jgi:hypothetical protein
MSFFHSLYSWHWRGWAAVAAFGLALFFARVLFPAASARAGGSKVVELQRAHTPESFRKVLEKWSASRADAIGIMKRENIVKLDFIFPVLYGLCFAFAYAAFRGNSNPGSLDILVFSLPFVAGLFDWIENSLHLLLLRGITTASHLEGVEFPSSLVFTASFFAHAKFALLGISLLSLVPALILRLWNRG